MRIQESREGGPEPESRTEEDRVVSRRVHNPTQAAEEDERTYAAAGDRDADDSPDPDEQAASTEGSTTERAAQERAAADESEPTRSE
jgi:hypothetical protein